MTTIDNSLVYGERIGDLMPALLVCRESMTLDSDGMYRGSFVLEPAVANPFSRALMRAEAELLHEDADRVGSPDYSERTHEQRLADALVRLTLAVASSA